VIKKKVENIIWNKARECMEPEEKERLQLAKLQATVKRVYQKVPHYRRALQERGIGPEDICSLADLKQLPFTVKQDLRDNYPFGMFAVPKSEIVRIHASSGTTGKPTVVAYTRSDLDNWAELVARSLVCAGATHEDTVQVAYGYGLFTGGLGAHYGAERIGATVVPISGGNTERQVTLMQDFGVTVLACTPSYALHIAEVAREMGSDLRELPLRAGIFGAEPWSDNMRKKLEAETGISAVDIYGLSEVMGPGVACQCQVKEGLHVFDDHFLVEVIDPVSGETLQPGQEGELVFTSLSKEAFPIIRYRTRDVSAIIEGPCPCGRTHVRIKRICGRTDDMLIIRGVNVFPSQIESVLLEIGETEPHYQLIVDRHGQMDELEVLVEVSEHMFSDKVRGLEELERKIHHRIVGLLGISCKVKLVEPKTIERTSGKAKRVIDRRKI
jgi:phenylacetate-CoA ligase